MCGTAPDSHHSRTSTVKRSTPAFSREVTNNGNLTQTEVVLDRKNFRVVGNVSGESEQNYWLGIGGMSKKSLGESAMSSMYRNADLKPLGGN